jgi:outer membrane protein assembly factor BamA
MLAVIVTFLSFFSFQEDSGRVFLPVDSLQILEVNKPQTKLTDTARFVQISRVVVMGNRLTRDRIILRELSLKSGDIIHGSELAGMLDLDKKKLINTRLFNTVEIKTLESEPGRIDLIVDVSERWYTFPAPIFELSDRNFNEWWENYNHDFRRVNVGLKLYQFNMRGRNETLRLVAQVGFLKKFELTYRIPYFDRKQKQGLIIDFDYTDTKNVPFRTVDHKLDFLKDGNILRITRGGSLTYTYRNSFYQLHALRAEYRSNSIIDTVQVRNPEYFSEGEQLQRYGILSYTFTSDRRDYFGYPLNGYYLLANVAQSGLVPKDDVHKLEVSVTYARFFDLKKGYYLSNNVIGYWSTPRELPYSVYGALGYRKQFVRGYEVYVIEGPTYVINKTTLKKRIFSRTYEWNDMPIKQFRHIPLSIFLKTYADFGYVNNYPYYERNNFNTRLSNTLISGTGLGIDIVGSYDAVIRFEYSFNSIGGRGLFIHIKREF